LLTQEKEDQKTPRGMTKHKREKRSKLKIPPKMTKKRKQRRKEEDFEKRATDNHND
jgi:hypothetical protein